MGDWNNRSAAERGYGSRWQRLRLRVLARDLGLCQSCRRQGRTTPAAAVDHVRPRSQGGEAFPPLDGLQALCEACHAHKSAAERGHTLRPEIDVLTGWPVATPARYVGPLWRRGVAGWLD